MSRIRLGMVGGGEGAFIGAVHRLAARIDGRYDLVAGALSSTAEKARASGEALGLDPARSYGSFAEMAESEAAREDGIEELKARIYALLRRAVRQSDEINMLHAILEVGELQLDSNTYQANIQNDIVQLTSTEHRLLRYLMENADQVISLSQLLQDVWDYPLETGDPDLVRAHVRNLRTKIEKPYGLRYIRTVHGIGYMLAP